MVELSREEPPRRDVEDVRKVVAVLAHPLRMRLIIALDVESPLPADVIARRVDEPLHKVRRHLNTLVNQKMVGVSGEENRRNAVKRYFALERRPWIDIEEEALLSDRDRRRSAVGGIRVIFEEATRAASNPRLADRVDRMVANFPARVDEQGWSELSTLHHETLSRTREIIEESRARLRTSGEEPIGVIADQILLEAPQHAPGAGV